MTLFWALRGLDTDRRHAPVANVVRFHAAAAVMWVVGFATLYLGPHLMAMQSVFLSVLLTFARTSWYSSYALTTAAWGLEPLADQQLAGAIMWIPAGLVYLAVGLTLMITWVQATERESTAV